MSIRDDGTGVEADFNETLIRLCSTLVVLKKRCQMARCMVVEGGLVHGASFIYFTGGNPWKR